MRVALDSNILCYLANVDGAPDDAAKSVVLQRLVDDMLGKVTLIAPVQALGETVVVLRRSGRSIEFVKDALANFERLCTWAPTGNVPFRNALGLVAEHKLQFWDSLILAVAAEAGCSLLLSEDMQHGFVWQGLTSVNPLAAVPHPKLAA